MLLTRLLLVTGLCPGPVSLRRLAGHGGILPERSLHRPNSMNLWKTADAGLTQNV
jgi:hypothetical protein